MFEGILTLLNRLPGGSGTVVRPGEPERPKEYPVYIPPVTSTPRKEEPAHPMTLEEYDRWQAAATIAGMPRRIHENFVRQRQHEEMMAELRRIRRE